MSINFDFQVHGSWFKHQVLWRTNIEKAENLGSII